MSIENDRGLVSHFGISGSGKTHAMRQSVWRSIQHGATVVVFDRLREWSEVPDGLVSVTAEVETLDQAFAAIGEGARFVIVPGIPDVTGVERVASWAIDRGKLQDPQRNDRRGLALPEAHRLFGPNASLPKPFDEIVSAWRHYAADLWCDSQRVSRLCRHITEQSIVARFFASVGDRDLSIVKDIGGPEMVLAVNACAEILGRSGQVPPPPEDSGWHVEARYLRTPPYPIVRMRADGSLDTRALGQQRLRV